jgi:anti-anti-sigma factor
MPEPTPEPASVGVRQYGCEGGGLVIRLCGALDLVTSPGVVDALDAARAEDPAALVVDLTEVSFLGSAAMTMLLSAQHEIGEAFPLVVVADGSVTARPLRLVGVDRRLRVVSTLDRALDHLTSRDGDPA